MSIRNISRLILQKDFVNLSEQFQLKILISELIIRYELKQTDLIEKKIKSIRKDFKKILTEEERDQKILLIIEKLIYCNNIYTDKKLTKKINEIQAMRTQKEAENTDIINYNEWLNDIISR